MLSYRNNRLRNFLFIFDLINLKQCSPIYNIYRNIIQIIFLIQNVFIFQLIIETRNINYPGRHVV